MSESVVIGGTRYGKFYKDGEPYVRQRGSGWSELTGRRLADVEKEASDREKMRKIKADYEAELRLENEFRAKQDEKTRAQQAKARKEREQMEKEALALAHKRMRESEIEKMANRIIEDEAL